jgi:hypothetical protein
MQHERAAWKSSRMKQGHAYTLLKTLEIFLLPSVFGLWNRVSSVVRQWQEKVPNSRFFLSHSVLVLFSHSFFFVLSRSFLVRARE